jgi:hypothetical protein
MKLFIAIFKVIDTATLQTHVALVLSSVGDTEVTLMKKQLWTEKELVVHTNRDRE